MKTKQTKAVSRAAITRYAVMAAFLGIALSLAPLAFARPFAVPRGGGFGGGFGGMRFGGQAPHSAPAPHYRPGTVQGNGQHVIQHNAPGRMQTGPQRPQGNPYARPNVGNAGPNTGARPQYVRPNGAGGVSGQPGYPAGRYGAGGDTARPAYNASQFPSLRANPNPYGGRPYAGDRNTGHLPEWMAQHQNMPVGQQEQLLRQEPGFNRLNPGDQQRLVQQLHRMNQLPEAQRQRRLARAEALERLSPAQQMQVKQAVRRMQTLAPDRQLMVHGAFRDLRGVPPEQRETVLNSARYTSTFSPEERGILSNMLRIEPYEAPQ
ncbi:DUF3106 domain-containing protein [Acidicapsa ligni]|uniref:DUF3106 domain-containing protein n=1 Tax=Acidicapsa ligni TaxID=542300 RepID=UPI0021DF5841|nr:DUF3106 domain-containing protein [Acidicapsa ligni]